MDNVDAKFAEHNDSEGFVYKTHDASKPKVASHAKYIGKIVEHEDGYIDFCCDGEIDASLSRIPLCEFVKICKA